MTVMRRGRPTGLRLSDETEITLLECYEAGVRAIDAWRKVTSTGANLQTVYLRYQKWKRDGVPRPTVKQRVRGQPKPYTGPTWIGKAITK